jgi:hypothetical protein
MMEVSLKHTTAWLAYIDIYGFGPELTDPNLAALSEKLRALQAAIDKIISIDPNLHLYMLSDSIVVFSSHFDGERARALTTLINCLVKIQTVAIELEFVFRGTVSNGNIVYGNRVCLGPALSRAVRLEAQLALPLVIVPEIEIDRTVDIFPFEPAGPLVVPTKGGLILGTPIFPAPIDKFRQHARKRFVDSAKAGPDHVAKVWAELDAFVNNLPRMDD